MAIMRRVHKVGGGETHMVVPEFAFATNVGTNLSGSGGVPSTFPVNVGDKLVQMIVDAWQDNPFSFPSGGTTQNNLPLGKTLIARNDKTGLPTQLAIDCATYYLQTKVGLNLSRAVVITEQEHDNNYFLQSDNEIAFVLPDPTRVVSIPPASSTPNQNLLQTAQFLMACTPNGI